MEVSVGAGEPTTVREAESVWLSIVALTDAVPALAPAVNVDVAAPEVVVATPGSKVPREPVKVAGVPSGTAKPELPSLPVTMLAVKGELAPALMELGAAKVITSHGL
jgi:hypothetical protein